MRVATPLAAAPAFDTGSLLIESIGLLAVILVGFLVLMRLRGRLHGGDSATSRLALVETMRVGPRRSLLVVRVGGGLRLIGSSETGLSDLGAIAEEIPDTGAEELVS